jgi:drug/metabolite transporter (DMT)-like permease
VSLVYGIVTALVLGASDVCAARAARHVPSLTVARTALLASVLVSPLLLLVRSVTWTADDVLLGAASGLSLCAALGLLYRGYATAPVGIVAPTSSVLIGLVPVMVDVADGDRPSGLAAVGVAVGLSAVVLAAYSPGGAGTARAGLAFGLGSGSLFGLAFVLMDRTSEAAGLSPVLVQRAVGLVVLTAVMGLVREPWVATRPPSRTFGLAAGVLAAVALGSLQLGFRAGSAGLVSVAASQFATTAVVLSVVFTGERLRWWQAVGVAATAVGVALIAAG